MPRLPTPRWQTPLPETVAGSWGPLVAAYADTTLGIGLDRWQRKAINRALAVDADGRLVHRIYLISTARQNGKTAIVRAIVGTTLTSGWPLPWSFIAGVAFDRKQAMIPYRAVHADLGPVQRQVGTFARGGLALTRYLGLRSAMYGRVREYHVYSREARDSLRGESVDLGLFDEVRTQRNYELWAALEPTTTARPMPLILATSSAGDDRSTLLRDWWERGRRIIDGAELPYGFGMTWYAASDELADLKPEDPRAVRAWRQANPSLAEGRLTVEAIRSGIAAATGQAMARAERLNLWTDRADDELFPPGLWHARIGPQPVNLEGVRVALGIEAVPSWRRVTVTVAIATDFGTWTGVAGELDSATMGTASIDPADAQDLAERLCRQWKPVALAVSAAAAAAPYARAAGGNTRTPVVELGPRQIRAASQLLRSELIGSRLTHPADELLQQQVRVARASGPLEGADWYIGIRQSLGEVDAIRAVAWATYVAISPAERNTPVQVFV